MIRFDLWHQPAVQIGNITHRHVLDLDPHPIGSMCSLQLFHPQVPLHFSKSLQECLETGSYGEMCSPVS